VGYLAQSPLTVPARLVRDRSRLVRGGLVSEPAAHGYMADGVGPKPEPRIAYVLVNTVPLDQERRSVKPSAQLTLARIQRLPP
jgi:hypothetical protein